MDLSVDELRTIRESLDYSIERVKAYPHQEPEYKETSLKPLIDVREKVRRMIAWGR